MDTVTATAAAAVVPSSLGTNAVGGELSAAAAIAAVPPSEIGDDDRLTSTTPPPPRQFALLKSSQTVVLRAAYGPFLSSQTVTPSSSRVALFAADYQGALSNGGSGSNNVSFSEPPPAVFAPPTAADAAAAAGASGSPYLDLSAHLVTREVRKDQPVLRVVFHAGQSVRQHGAPPRKKVGGGGMCIVLSAQLTANKTVEATCTPQGTLLYSAEQLMGTRFLRTIKLAWKQKSLAKIFRICNKQIFSAKPTLLTLFNKQAFRL